MAEEEIWKFATGYEGIYKVSSLGRIKSLRNGKTREEKFLKGSLNGRGYCTTSLSKNGISKTVSIHQLVACIFLDHVPNGNKMVVDHINGDKTDNRVENLRIVTNRDNLTLGLRKDQSLFTSQYSGVHWSKNENRWRSSIHINGKKKYLGSFLNEIDASIAYKNALLAMPFQNLLNQIKPIAMKTEKQTTLTWTQVDILDLMLDEYRLIKLSGDKFWLRKWEHDSVSVRKDSVRVLLAKGLIKVERAGKDVTGYIMTELGEDELKLILG